MDVTGWLRKQLEQASPDLRRAMVQEFAEALMGAEVDALCGAPYGEQFAGAEQQAQRLPRTQLGHARRLDRARGAEAQGGLVLPGLAAAGPPARGAGVRV